GTVFAISPNAAWVSPGGSAEYIAPDISQGAAFSGGVYTLDYVTSFDLTGFNPSSVLINGLWSTDNSGVDIFVNGHSTGMTSPSFTSLTSFALSGGSGFFTSGANELDFRWSNAGGPGGLAVIFSLATADPASQGVPEPASLFLLGAGLATLAVAGQRYRSRQR
ncbi:MAG TPA: PEP-CTERM sorting domain-containing protein, partial [Candidatus Solibacter sp.]|nr:PEP-CTERM sorting domain-containing protein [Candidatus Solibacter sp.]